jgi:hypothetical protein
MKVQDLLSQYGHSPNIQYLDGGNESNVHTKEASNYIDCCRNPTIVIGKNDIQSRENDLSSLLCRLRDSGSNAVLFLTNDISILEALYHISALQQLIIFPIITESFQNNINKVTAGKIKKLSQSALQSLNLDCASREHPSIVNGFLDLVNHLKYCSKSNKQSSVLGALPCDTITCHLYSLSSNHYPTICKVDYWEHP